VHGWRMHGSRYLLNGKINGKKLEVENESLYHELLGLVVYD
jgi:hypothetical protein